MEIQANDVLGFVKNVEKQFSKKTQTRKVTSENQPLGTETKTQEASRLTKGMATVLQMQNEIRSLQTKYSRYQGALAFLEDNSQKEGLWQDHLNKFLKASFHFETANLPDNKEEFIQESKYTLASLKSQILKKEIQMQNIFAASPFSDNDSQQAMQKVLENLNTNKESMLTLNSSSVRKLTDENL